MKKVFAFAGLILLAAGSFAQTNLQVFYDFGKDRKHVTTTIEMFKGDDWGNTFFFVDYDYNWKNNKDKVIAPNSTYFEIARCLNFWGESALAPLSLQVEYNGGFGTFGNGAGCFNVENAWLFGVDYFLHSDDFNNTLNLKVLYKKWAVNDGTPLQFTVVWGMQDLFGVKGLRFSGFVDFWGQNARYTTKEYAKLSDAEKLIADGKEAAYLLGGPDTGTYRKNTKWVLLSEPQLWYAIGQHFGCENLNIGGEVEISNNFTQEGFMCNPCLGVKWNF